MQLFHIIPFISLIEKKNDYENRNEISNHKNKNYNKK